MKFILFILWTSFFSFTSQNCVWYGECNNENGKIQNCLALEEKPRKLTREEESIAILRRKCPLFLEKVPEREFCCDDDQLITMENSMNHAAMFERCPTCMNNLNLHICNIICSPNQTDFIKVTDWKEGGNQKHGNYITRLEVHLSKEYKEKTFESCKEVGAPSTGEKVITMSCGVWGAAGLCTSERWFNFFGDDRENDIIPFFMDYNPPPNPEMKTLHINALPCNESYEGLRACSCSDCEASCTIPFELAEPRKSFRVGQIDGVAFIMIIIFFVLSGAALFFFIRHHRTEIPPPVRNISRLDFMGEKLLEILRKMFTKWGTGCARNPTLVFAIASWIIAALGYGVQNLRITTDPTEIWASPTCKSRMDKIYYDSRFTPFYRTNQVFIKTKGLKPFTWISSDNFSFTFGPAFHPQFLEEVYHLQMQIQQLGVPEGNSLQKICFAPMKNEFFNEDSVKYCAVQSVWGYLQNDVSVLKNPNKLYDTLQKCLRNNFDPSCLAPYGGPIFSPLAVGGPLEENPTDPLQNKHLLATGVTLTFMVNNALNKTDLEPALAWEKMFIDFLSEWKKKKPDFMEIAYSAERSIEDEIEKESKAEMTTIIISYFVMFIYITVSLGRIRGFKSLLLDSKFTLGMGGIVIVLASVIASLGVFGYLGVSTTLLTVEVIPFLVLAVGVDNIFILVHTYQQLQQKNGKFSEELIGVALGKVGPSILLTSTSEAACFLIGTLSDMPAIKTFAQYSSLAIILNFLLQISCFISLLAVDFKRQKNNYADIFCCFKVKNSDPSEETSDILFLVFKEYYGPFLMKTWVRISVIMFFILWLCFSIACIPHIERGLDQELSMPEGSHVIDYFQYMKDLLDIGPPVYFVLKSGIDFTNSKEVNAICGSVGCDPDSMVTYLTRASRLSNVSYIGKSPSSWIDDYFDWLSSSQNCCKQFPGNESFCPHQYPECERCSVTIEDWRPNKEDFRKYLPYFLNDNPDFSCPKGGHAAYAGGVNFEMNHLGELNVTDNYFMAYHTSLKTSKDFYMALDSARQIADHLSLVLTKKLNRTIEVFPYSIFYVFYEQYLTIVKDAIASISYSLLAVFAVTFLFTGFSFRSSFLVVIVVASMVINMAAMLYWWNITLNAVSLVNLLVAVGIGVEFCSHILRAYALNPNGDKISRSLHAISTMGSSVFSGITLTKFLGIVVLAFAQTLMLRTFYFRMYLGIVVMGAAHGLILMPIMLSYFG